MGGFAAEARCGLSFGFCSIIVIGHDQTYKNKSLVEKNRTHPGLLLYLHIPHPALLSKSCCLFLQNTPSADRFSFSTQVQALA